MERRINVLDGLLWAFDRGAFDNWLDTNGRPVVKSKSELRRLLDQGAIRINSRRVSATDPWPESIDETKSNET